MSYHACLAFATVWSRAGKERQHELQAAAKFLGLLRNEFPHALEIDEELVLVHLELGQPSEANKLLDEMEARYGDQVSDEILCRWGRREKDEAVKHWNTHELTAIARQHFAKAIDWYRKAYSRSRSYYPAVNVASLQYLLSGGNADAKVDIDEAHKALQQWQQPAADELCWFNATWGELFFLRGEHDAAKQKYQAAVEGQDCPQQYKQTMLRQLRLLLRLANQQATAFWTEPSLEEVFGTEACKALPA
jgi:tetratricopeptide (TPR) repeat protein